jgi:phosphoribosylamine--glycine ligase
MVGRAPLCAGWSTICRRRHQGSVWPARAARSSKARQDLCKANAIPTAAYQLGAAMRQALRARRARRRRQADGLAAGKGVIIASTMARAEAAST